MVIITTKEDLALALESFQMKGQTVGFVPTMGALHEGHMALIRKAKAENDVVFSSVFVNPTQFNNAKDLELYPRTPEKDAELLAQNGCDYAFFPSVELIYPSDYEVPVVDLGSLEKVMEGEFRPGHFKGVVQVVYRLFDLIQPDSAYFGLKDFQQVAVIQHMVRVLNMKVKIVPCMTLRATDGLALSSRNMRLSADQKVEALHIYKTMQYTLSLTKSHTPAEAKRLAISFFEHSEMRLEYLSIVHPQTLEELSDSWVSGATICIACFCGEVRLIDNLQLID